MNQINFQKGKFNPCKVVCVGRNYVAHIEELGNEIPQEMVLFVKPNSSISKELAQVSDDCHYEGEISFLVKDKKLYAVGFGLDLTKRDMQSKLKSKGLPWERAKSFDKAAVFSDFIKLEDDINSLRLELQINGKLAQSGGVDLMIYKPETVLKEIESFMSLDDFDIIMTGTPKGVGRYKKDDEFIGRIYSDEKLLVEKTWIVK
jgi:2-keto-4-pentenoate hydratase/2-oxohepta-3-ene-1,7-dioic acid hydratase in catechol pathway